MTCVIDMGERLSCDGFTRYRYTGHSNRILDLLREMNIQKSLVTCVSVFAA